RGNRIYNQSQVGVESLGQFLLSGNRIYSNAIGFRAAGSIAQRRSFGEIERNLIYDNQDVAIAIDNQTGGALIGNTIWHSIGNAIQVDGASSDILINANQIRVDSGEAIRVSTQSTSTFTSDGNLFFASTGAAAIGTWGNTQAVDLASWRALSAQDAESIEGDPMWVDADGADNSLGYDPVTLSDDGPDDLFIPARGSIAIDRLPSALTTTSDFYGQPHSDDPSSANGGPNNNWIADIGAVEFGGDSSDVTAPQVTATTPNGLFAGGILGSSFEQFTIAFSESMQPSMASFDGNYLLVSAGPDDILDSADDVILDLSANYRSSENSVDLSPQIGRLAPGLYRLALTANGLLDQASNPLDGDGDSTGGDDWVVEFSVPNEWITTSIDTVVIGEGGASATVTLALQTVPTGTVTLPISLNDPSEAMLSETDIIFTPTNYDEPRHLIVTGLDDDVVDGDTTFDIVFGQAQSNDPRFNVLQPEPIGLINRDNDPAGVLLTLIGDNQILESGGTRQVEVLLISQPPDDVVVTVATSDPTQGLAAPSVVVFGSDNWDTPQQITITGVDDDRVDPDTEFTLDVLTVESNDLRFDGTLIDSIRFVSVDEDAATLELSTNETRVIDEQGRNSFADIVLSSRPAADVTLRFSVSDATEVTLDRSELTITPDEWNAVHRISIHGVSDNVIDGDQTTTIEFEASLSQDPLYDGIQLDPLAVTTEDSDVADLLVGSQSISLVTEGESRQFSVALASRPQSDVTIPITVSDTNRLQLGTASIVFTPSNALVSQLVTLTVLDDSVFTPTSDYQITLGTPTTSDPDYATLAARDLTVTVIDDDPVVASITNRRLFYNDSFFDGNTIGFDPQDEAAIATDKVALANGETASFSNYTNFHHGINGLIVDIVDLAGTPTIDDFEFRVGNDNDPSGWNSAVAPIDFVLELGGGPDASDRIKVLWANGAIKNTWLQVRMLANSNTGLVADDVFYFGNAVGETGNTGLNAFVDATDAVGVADNANNFLSPASIESVFDFNRDRFIDGTDYVLIVDNQTNFLTDLNLITPQPPGSSRPNNAKTFSAPFDVDKNGIVSALDALLIINTLSASLNGATPSSSSDTNELVYNAVKDLDVNFDGVVSPLDALNVINHLAIQSSQQVHGEQVDSFFHSLEEDDESIRSNLAPSLRGDLF
ncbi:MAG: right-handed parallel beta-helix repeat-containing protein, partial [Planctomycetota bacterium]